MNEFIQMAKALSELKIFDINEVALFLEQNFKCLKSVDNDSIISRRVKLLNEFNLTLTKKNMIENQLLAAKLKYNEGIKSETKWLIDTKYAFRATKQKLDQIKNALTKLKMDEKEVNKNSHESEDDKLLKYFIEREKEGKTKEEFLNHINDIKSRL